MCTGLPFSYSLGSYSKLYYVLGLIVQHVDLATWDTEARGLQVKGLPGQLQ